MNHRATRRQFLAGAAAAASLAVVPRNVLGGAGQAPPSETFAVGVVGCGGQSGEDCRTYIQHAGGHFKMLACSDLHEDRLANAVNRKFKGATPYKDFRRLVERKDLDVVSVATPPHWHALVAVAAMAAGKDVLCEKPMTKFIAEGRAVVNAAKRYGRVFQIGTGGRWGAASSTRSRLIHNVMRSGLLKQANGVEILKGGYGVKRYCGQVNPKIERVPPKLDWDTYCGPAPLRPYHRDRFGWNHRFYWDYEGGGLTDLGAHKMDPTQWRYAKDYTSPVEIVPYAPPQHPEACGPWGWVELKYADGFMIVLDGGEWGKPYERAKTRHVDIRDLDEESQAKVKAMPDPEPLLKFPEAVRTRKKSAGHAEAAHRAVTALHLANIAIRMGRPIRFDPDAEQILGDDEANRLVNQPMRAPWRL